ncbi:MAG: hypothetical protein WDZ85_00785 [Candidatus Paceibacterota bacterium]
MPNNKTGKVIAVYKPFGLTPLATLHRLREKYPEYRDVKLSYAGRLDPLAEGIMPVLIGEANYDREKYLGLDKEYEFTILFGVRTDTGDVLGRITDTGEAKNLTAIALEKFLADNLGTIDQTYPAYSAPIIAGKKSFRKQVKIYQAEVLHFSHQSAGDVVVEILAKLERFNNLNPGQNFRQSEILTGWQKLADTLPADLVWARAEVKLAASSGTYVRVLAERAGQALGCPALALAINRTKVGGYEVSQALKI